jgi:hypothetical protein
LSATVATPIVEGAQAAATDQRRLGGSATDGWQGDAAAEGAGSEPCPNQRMNRSQGEATWCLTRPVTAYGGKKNLVCLHFIITSQKIQTIRPDQVLE